MPLAFEQELEELYKIAVGILNISPSVFYTLTPHEINLAYEGYLNKREDDVNGMIVAIKKAFCEEDEEAFSIEGTLGYAKSTLAARESTFNDLGL